MSGELWQHALAALAAVGALAWLVRRRRRKQQGCADCSLAEAVTRSSPRDE